MPPGWIARESIVVAAPEQAGYIRVASNLLPSELTIEEFANACAKQLCKRLPGYEELAVETVQLVGGQPALLRSFRWTPPERDARAELHLYAVRGQRGILARAISSAAHFAEVEPTFESCFLVSAAEHLRLEAAFCEPRARRGNGERCSLRGRTAHNDTRESFWNRNVKRGARGGGGRTMSADSPVAADYSADELTAVGHLLAVPAFPNVSGAVFADLDPAAQEATLRSARRSLLARGVVEIDDEGILRVAAPHGVLFRVALAPAAVVNAEVRRTDSIETRSYYALPSVAVEHSSVIGHIHRLSQFESAQLFDRVVEFLGLVERPSGESADAELSISDLNRALAGEKVDEGAFGQALASLVSTSFVRSLSRDNGTLVGGELRWIDTGDAGLWLVEPSKEEPERLNIRRTEAADLHDELLAYLPVAERQPAT